MSATINEKHKSYNLTVEMYGSSNDIQFAETHNFATAFSALLHGQLRIGTLMSPKKDSATFVVILRAKEASGATPRILDWCGGIKVVTGGLKQALDKLEKVKMHHMGVVDARMTFAEICHILGYELAFKFLTGCVVDKATNTYSTPNGGAKANLTATHLLHYNHLLDVKSDLCFFQNKVPLRFLIHTYDQAVLKSGGGGDWGCPTVINGYHVGVELFNHRAFFSVEDQPFLQAPRFLLDAIVKRHGGCATSDSVTTHVSHNWDGRTPVYGVPGPSEPDSPDKPHSFQLLKPIIQAHQAIGPLQAGGYCCVCGLISSKDVCSDCMTDLAIYCTKCGDSKHEGSCAPTATKDCPDCGEPMGVDETECWHSDCPINKEICNSCGYSINEDGYCWNKYCLYSSKAPDIKAMVPCPLCKTLVTLDSNNEMSKGCPNTDCDLNEGDVPPGGAVLGDVYAQSNKTITWKKVRL